MRASSPLIAVYKTPLKGMDAREVKPQDAPNLLFNVDLSNRGYWKERPGVKKFFDTGRTDESIVGLYATRFEKEFFLIIIYARSATSNLYLRIVDGAGVNVYGPANLTDPSSGTPSDIQGSSEYDVKNYFSFVRTGRFVYFCNGTGDYWELEKTGRQVFDLKKATLEAGLHPLLLSYISSGLKPRSFSYFYEQIVISGFLSNNQAPLTIASDYNESENQPPSQVLNLVRDEMTVDPGAIFVSEPALWKSFPVNEPNGFFWVYNEDVLASAGINYDLLVFGTKRLYKIQGFGTPTPRRIRLSDTPSVSPRGFCYFDKYVFFVSFDGCYVTDGSSVQKVSFEMDPLWFGREEPQTTRYVEQQIQKGPYPFHVNRRAMSSVCCINDQFRQQVMVCLPSGDSHVNNMVWVYNYSDLVEGSGKGKWSIWGSDEEPTFSGTSLDGEPFTRDTGSGPSRNNPASAPSQSNTTYNMFHWLSVTDDIHNGEQRIFVGNDRGKVLEFGVSRQDLREVATYNLSGEKSGSDAPVHFPVAVSLGRVGRVDSDGRIICTDVAVRRKQLSKNLEDSSSSTKLQAIVRSEGEGLKHFDVSEADVEFADTILNSQQGVSENTKSTLNTLQLGASPTGSNAPLMNSEYLEAYARVNIPDEEGRAAYVDLYSMPTDEPHRMQISEVRVHANIKGGSQREQS